MTNIWIINSNQIATISHSINYRPQHIKRENTTNNMRKNKISKNMEGDPDMNHIKIIKNKEHKSKMV